MTTANLSPSPYLVFRDSNGTPLALGSVTSYIATTTTPQATYTDQAAGTPNSNPLVLDINGGAVMWLRNDLSYKFVIKDALGNVIRTTDKISITNIDSIDKTMIASDLAGIAMAQAAGGELDVQVDNVTIDVNGSNQLEVKAGGITVDSFSASSQLEVVIKRVRDYSNPGSIQHIPQLTWATPSKLSDPGTLPPGGTFAARWSPCGEFLAMGSGTTPYIDIYQRVGDVLTKLADPGTLPTGQVQDLSWSPCGDFLAVAHAQTPCVTIYHRVGNTFTKLSDPSSVPALDSTGQWAKFSPNSDFLALSSIGTTTGVIMYERSGTTFTDVTSGSGLGTLTKTASSGIAWSPDSSLFLGVSNATGKILAYSRANALFSSITAPDTTSLSDDVLTFAFSPNGKLLAVVSLNSPYLAVYSVTNGVFAQLTNPVTLPTGSSFNIAWAPNSKYLAIGHNTTPFMTIYSIAGTTFTKISNPSSLPVASVVGLDWSPTKQYLATSAGLTPYVQIYKTSSSYPTNAIMWTREVTNV